jgi:hypothetical protein
MSFYGGVNPYEIHRFGFDYIDSIEKQRAVSPAPNEQPVSRFRDPMDDTTRHALRMRKALEAVKELMPASAASSEIEVNVAASTTSAANVSLGPLAPATATTLQSAEEVNSATTSYSPTAPEVNGRPTPCMRVNSPTAACPPVERASGRPASASGSGAAPGLAPLSA